MVQPAANQISHFRRSYEAIWLRGGILKEHGNPCYCRRPYRGREEDIQHNKRLLVEKTRDRPRQRPAPQLPSTIRGRPGPPSLNSPRHATFRGGLLFHCDRLLFLLRFKFRKVRGPRRSDSLPETAPAERIYGEPSGGVRLTFCCDRYKSALSARYRGSRSPAFALAMMCLARIVRPARAYSSVP